MTGKTQLLILFLVIVGLREGLGKLVTWKRHDQIRAETGYPVKVWVNVTKGYVPQSIMFDVCEVLACGYLNAQRQLSRENKYLCPEPKTSRMFEVPPCPNVWWTTNHKGWSHMPTSTVDFMRLKKQINILKGCNWERPNSQIENSCMGMILYCHQR